MPKFAYVDADVRCPTCQAVVIEYLMIQWGRCPSQLKTEAESYAVGDPIQWRLCKDGSIRPWTYFAHGRYLEEANIGDPAYTDLIVRDSGWNFYWVDPAQKPRCQHCSTSIEGAAVEIRDGVIRRAWIYTQGELGEVPADHNLILENGQLQPMPEWDDREIERISDC
jgi:hypothetical protein